MTDVERYQRSFGLASDDEEVTMISPRKIATDEDWLRYGAAEDWMFWNMTDNTAGGADLIDEVENYDPVTPEMVLEVSTIPTTLSELLLTIRTGGYR